MKQVFLPSVLALALAACGGSSTGDGGADSGNATDSGGNTDSGQGPCTANCIPDPGTSDAVDNNWGSVAPNSTPAEATPLGTAAGADIYSWVNSNDIGGSDTTNYFVFRTSATAGTLSFDFCFASPLTSMTATMWVVANGVQQEPAVATWNSTGTCVTNMPTPTPIEASTVYLFELTGTGGAGTYSA
jgi:hypothetical protein